MLRNAYSTIRTRIMTSSLPTTSKMPSVPKKPILMVLGATGTGKSQLAITLAKRFNGEVINSDAMQLYAGLEVVTNKISVEEMEGVRHHLIGEVKLEEEVWRVGKFRRKVEEIVENIRGRGKIPVVCGGTGYYLQNLLGSADVLVDEPGEGEEAAQRGEGLEKHYDILKETVSTADMYAALQKVDPVMAARWHPNDRRKIRRSLEIWLKSGRAASEIYGEQKKGKNIVGEIHGQELASREYAEAKKEVTGNEDVDGENDGGIGDPLLFWIHAEDKILKERLNKRVDKMIHSGLLSEVQEMGTFLHDQDAAGSSVDRTQGIWVSIGFKEFEKYLNAKAANERGEESEDDKVKDLYEEAVELTKGATRRYAKRQVRWIRLKLIPALQEQNRLEKLFLLDGTDLLKWEESVITSAMEVTKSFLEGQEMPVPAELNDAAKEFLLEEKAGEGKPDVWFREECLGCKVICVTNLQWAIHLKSRKHRGILKRAEKQKGGFWDRKAAGKGEMEANSNVETDRKT